MRKTVLSLVLIFILFCSLTVTPQVSAYSYPKVSLGKSVKGNLKDFWGGITYELDLTKSKKVKFTYSSTVNTEVVLRDSKLNIIFSSSEIRKVNKTVNLKKGKYTFGIYNCTYDNGNYKLSLKDSTKYTKSISFKVKKHFLSSGESVKLSVIKNPKKSIIKKLSWSSSNKSVATVNKNGKVTAKGLGKCTITAKLNNGNKAYCTIIVNKKIIKMFKRYSKTLPKINGKNISWESKKTSVVKVNGNKLKGVSQGSALVVRNEGGVKYSLNVYVTDQNRLIKSARLKIRSELPNPKSMRVFHTYTGYDSLGNPCVVLDYGVKNSSQMFNRAYFICNYSNKFVMEYRYSNINPSLKGMKEI